MPFVQRDDIGNITGMFANKQDGFAEEELSESDPQIITFRKAAEEAMEKAMSK